ncbi:MAG: hypothetical protein RLZZ344_1094 [Pseudomonadota bacterium]|jgi:hypothetical protein
MNTLFVLFILGVLALPFIHAQYLQQTKGYSKREAYRNFDLMGFGYILVAAPVIAQWVARPW